MLLNKCWWLMDLRRFYAWCKSFCLLVFTGINMQGNSSHYLCCSGVFERTSHNLKVVGGTIGSLLHGADGDVSSPPTPCSSLQVALPTAPEIRVTLRSPF